MNKVFADGEVPTQGDAGALMTERMVKVLRVRELPDPSEDRIVPLNFVSPLESSDPDGNIPLRALVALWRDRDIPVSMLKHSSISLVKGYDPLEVQKDLRVLCVVQQQNRVAASSYGCTSSTAIGSSSASTVVDGDGGGGGGSITSA